MSEKKLLSTHEYEQQYGLNGVEPRNILGLPDDEFQEGLRNPVYGTISEAREMKIQKKCLSCDGRRMKYKYIPGENACTGAHVQYLCEECEGKGFLEYEMSEEKTLLDEFAMAALPQIQFDAHCAIEKGVRVSKDEIITNTFNFAETLMAERQRRINDKA